jgi:hypothetical protein
MFFAFYKMEYVVQKLISDDDMKRLEGQFFKDMRLKIFKSNVDMYDENGNVIVKFRKNIFTPLESQTLFQLHGAAKLGKTRPSASGIPPEGKYKYIISKSSGKPLQVLTTKARSGIVGFYDSVSNFGRAHAPDLNEKCRQTAYTLMNLTKYKSCIPIFQKIDQIFKKLVPHRYKAQYDAILKLDPKYRIPKTVFTTVTVNKNFRTALHKDGGDYKEGFGNLVVASQGDYQGGYTLFPQYGFGIDCRDGDFLAMDVHQWHCNSEIKGTGTRISLVFYLRDKMLKACPK